MADTPSLKQLHQDVEQMGDDIEKCKSNINNRLDQGAVQMNQLHTEVCANTDAMEKVSKSIETFMKIWEAGEGFVRVMGWLMTAAKWVLAVTAVVTAFLAIFHFGGSHKG